MSFSSSFQDANQLCDLAEHAAISLTDDSASCADRAKRAETVQSMIATILTLVHGAAPGGAVEIAGRLETIGTLMIEGARPLLTLSGDGYGFREISDQLNAASSLVAAVEAIIGSDALSLEQKEALVERVEVLLNPALHLVVRLVNPPNHEFDWVDDFWVRLGASAMSIAWRTSAIIEDKGRELRRARAEA